MAHTRFDGAARSGGGRPGPAGSAFAKDVRRTMTHHIGRFLSILVITALGVTVATGLQAACTDLKRTADAFFDGQHLHDIAIVSTLGLTDDDVRALGDVDGVKAVEGRHGETAIVDLDGSRTKVTVNALPAATDSKVMDEPYVVDGRLPADGDEVAVTQGFLTASGLRIGGKVTFSADDTASSTGKASESSDAATEIFKQHEYTIVGTVIDATDVGGGEGSSTAFRKSSTVPDHTFFVAGGAVNDDARDVYTSVILTVGGAADGQSFSDSYKTNVDAVRTRIDDISEKRERARTDAVKAAANATIDKEKAKADKDLDDAETRLDDAGRQLEQQRAYLVMLGMDTTQIDAAQRRLDEQRNTLNEQRSKAETEFADARAEVEKTDEAQWYVRDRTALSGYSSIDSDSKSIEAIGTVFPVLFLLVAVLISLTAITRMVEEERGLIGVYKALGYRKREILAKYVVYALLACVLGGILGDAVGFIVMPKILFSIFATMYQLPAYHLYFDTAYGLAFAALFVVAVVGSAIWACRSELRLNPAALLRPKAPRAGRRILLERFGLLWRRMSFLNKVTARNLFRYKSRAVMTIAGIMGCTMLMMCGFAIKDSVVQLRPNQYGGVVAYDLMAVTGDDDNAEALRRLRASDEVKDVLGVRVDSGTVSSVGGGREENVQLIVIPTGSERRFDDYQHLRSAQSDWSAALGGGERLTPTDSGAIMTKNAMQMLDLRPGDSVHFKDSTFNGVDVVIHDTAENYMGNTIIMTQKLYERLFGKAYRANGMLMHLNGDDTAQIDFADTLKRDDSYLSVTSVAELRHEFEKNFTLINTVVYVLLVLAGVLAFVVLFTLSTTNISERERELATIKVLGFRRGEVRHYVNKEMLLLTLMGVALGLPLGRLVSEGFTMVLRMPGIYFAVHVHWASYVISAALALGFAVVVTFVTDRMLDRIDMVGALKSPE
ncbi:FtsX-like permease family protein [Bifidobacterium sp. SMB2]|uniref:FtsX-like permease family protein n=1 Tax=Bifidobacterium saimiriisciurei TaxID=2661627 RepID=A0ABX0CE73_9BIFI|nr:MULTISPECIES: FtsX-like permease family protein [Bifidobacterium]NEG95772.1 FtsX-like permease family protein [Bifidobacterium sp. SMB2]NEH11199.1 FtsX-like permease family protein [Bifidobacterium saimiriisciurei]